MHVCSSNHAESVENGNFGSNFRERGVSSAGRGQGKRNAELRQRCEWQAQKQVRNFSKSEEGATLVSARYVTRLAANY